MRCLSRLRTYGTYRKKWIVTCVLLTMCVFSLLCGDDVQFVPATYMRKAGLWYSYSDINRGDWSWLNAPEDFFRRLEMEEGQTHCRKLILLGGVSCNKILDGGKYVCLDEDLRPKPLDCVVYSFGLATEISFDNAAARYGCTVYMMDPSLPPGSYHWLKGKQKFYPIGLGHTNQIFSLTLNYTDWEGKINSSVATFDEVQNIIGHHGFVNYLKIDIEGSEWLSLERMMDLNQFQHIQQIGIELHVSEFTTMPLDQAVSFLKKRWQFLERLEDHGFLRVRYDPTNSYEARYIIPGSLRTLQLCGELVLLKRAP